MISQVWRGRRWMAGALALAAVLGSALALALTLAPAEAVTRPVAQKDSPDRTSATEARRVDSVPTPKLAWRDCAVRADGAQCADVWLPLDYDQPGGAKTKVALLRHPARDQAHRIGSLILNPGGPGGSGTGVARVAPGILGPAVLDRFDVVGFDSRGMHLSDQVECFTSTAQQTKTLKGFEVGFPMGKAQERAYLASARSLAAGCSSTGRPLSASMSTAEVARDMDVLRRALGDRKLTYLGLSYGSYVGQVYANMFPDRVRALAIDGVLDPTDWVGSPATASRPQEDRTSSADGAFKALTELLRLCDRAGELKCRFAAGDPVANYGLLANRLKKTQLVLEDPSGRSLGTFTYADLVIKTFHYLAYAARPQVGFADLDGMLSDLMILTEPPAAARSRAPTAGRLKVMSAFVARLKHANAFEEGLVLPPAAYSSVACTDGIRPPDTSPSQFAAIAAAADNRAKYFGRFAAWQSAACASNTWTARDEDAYRGPFNRRTAAPVLVVGNTWDPGTNYEGAVAVASLLPNSRLLSSDNWGHVAYLNSPCVVATIDTYLLTQAVPARGTICHGNVQPFSDDLTATPD